MPDPAAGTQEEPCAHEMRTRSTSVIERTSVAKRLAQLNAELFKHQEYALEAKGSVRKARLREAAQMDDEVKKLARRLREIDAPPMDCEVDHFLTAVREIDSAEISAET